MIYLFDLDGTLISSYMDNSNKDYMRWHLLPLRKQVIEKLVQQGHIIGIVTNQAGVGLGYTTEQQVQERMDRGEEFTFLDTRNPEAWGYPVEPR